MHDFKIFQDSLWSQQTVHLANFTKLFLVSASDICHTNSFDGNDMFTRLDTLSYVMIHFKAGQN